MKYLNDVNYKDCIGKVCKSKLSGDFKILKYNDARNVEVQFLKTWFETVTQLGLQGYEDDDDFEILLQDALLAWVVETCDIKFTILDE